jgi:hypothetical protein
MEKFGIFITLESVSDFCTGLPVDRPLLNREVKGVHGEGTKGVFSERKGAMFFQNVKQVYKDAAVFLPLGLGEKTSRPFLARVPAEA